MDHLTREGRKMTKTRYLRELLKKDGALMVPCAFDGLSAMAIEKVGFPLAGTTGQGIHGALLGVPDNGLVAFNEMVETCGKIADILSIPLLADAEGGYGNAINAMRTVHAFEKAGVAGIFVEDQKIPPNCPFIKGTQTISVDEMVGKIKAMVAAKTDPDFLIIARTDAPFEEGVERAKAYLDAGADMIKPIPKNRKELELWPKMIHAPLHVGYYTGFGICDDLTFQDIGDMGYKMVTFPMSMVYLTAATMLKYLKTIKNEGTDRSMLQEMFSFTEYQNFVNRDIFAECEKKYLIDT